MSRTILAALLLTVLVSGSLAGLGVFLGFPTFGSLWFGIVAGVASGLLLLAASRRADSFHPTEDNAHLADHGAAFDPEDQPPPTEGADETTDDDPDERPGD